MESNEQLVIACIPAYNEESSIGSVVLRSKNYVDVVLVCDDGSGDLTGEIARGLGAQVLRHERNRGYGASLRTLFEEARRLGAKVVVTLDGDNQHDPNEIPLLLGRLEVGDVDIVVGSRFLKGAGENIPRMRKTGIKLITNLASNLGQQITDAQSGFRAYNEKALSLLVLTEEGMGASTEILLKANKTGLRIAEVPVNIRHGDDDSNLRGLTQGIDVIGSTIKHISIQHPMRFYSALSLFFLSIGVIFGLWALDIFWTEGRLVTNLTLISITSTIIALIFFMMGVLLYTLISVLRERS